MLGLVLLPLIAGAAAVPPLGGRLLVASDPLPTHADVLVVLAGSINAEQARREEAMRRLREGRADRIVFSAPHVMFWGEWVPDLMRRNLERLHGPQAAARALLCPHKADSTSGEAEALRACLERHGWRRVIVVTSNYHTRRAGYIWRTVFSEAHPPFHIFMHGASDGDFEPRGWWRRRRDAKTFLHETTKLVWTYLFE